MHLLGLVHRVVCMWLMYWMRVEVVALGRVLGDEWSGRQRVRESLVHYVLWGRRGVECGVRGLMT